MNRRSFFKLLAASVTVAAVPKPVLAAAQAIGETVTAPLGHEYGASIPVGDYSGKMKQWATEFLVKHAREALGVGVVVNIRMALPFNYGRDKALAWYTNDQIRLGDANGLHAPIFNKERGYFDLGTVRT